MIRLVFLLRRRDGLSLDEFHDRWRLDHGPLVASHQTRLGILRYTQSHRLDDPLNAALAGARGGMEPPYDGVAELWWESEATLAEASSTEAGRLAGAELLADEAEFIDLPASPLWLAHEYPQVNPTPEHLVARPTNRHPQAALPAAPPFRAVARRRPALLADPARAADPLDGAGHGDAAVPAGPPLRVPVRGRAARRPRHPGRAVRRSRRGLVRADDRRARPGGGRGGAPGRRPTRRRSSTSPARRSGSARSTSSSIASDRPSTVSPGTLLGRAGGCALP